MKLSRHPYAWTWACYAAPCVILMVLSFAGIATGEALRLGVWLYGFPSTALLLPVLSYVGNISASDLAVTCLVAGLANGGLICGIIILVRDAAKPEPPEDAPSETGRLETLAAMRRRSAARRPIHHA